jgi:hypothetical protein
MNEKYYQQGDVIITPISGAVPESAKPVAKAARGNVLREGEATGHAHVVESKKGRMFTNGNKLLLEILADQATVVHEEHKPITLNRGLYEIGAVIEADPFSEEIRKVAD